MKEVYSKPKQQEWVLMESWLGGKNESWILISGRVL